MHKLLSSDLTFPYIEDYAFLSDCEVNCLISSDGSVEWMCVPRPDSPSIFGNALDRSAGFFSLNPHGVMVPVSRRYIPGSLILETTWQTPTGWIIVRDALVMGPWNDNVQRSPTHRRTPTDWDSDHILLRAVECVSGTVDLVMRCEPAFDYARSSGQWEYTSSGYCQAKCTDPSGKGPDLTLSTNMRLGIEHSYVKANTKLSQGDNIYVALTWSPEAIPPSNWEEASQLMWNTQEFWRQWISMGDFPDHPWREHLQQSALTLKGLTYAPTGALLAAATTSLPEAIGGERNWDYRYTWVRDSTFALWGLYTLGLDKEAEDFFSFITEMWETGDHTEPIQVLYGVGGERTIAEDELHHLSGYCNTGPVRIGNAAYSQNQHDIWGALIDSIYIHTKSNRRIPEYLWVFIKEQIREVEMHWKETDRGIWEVRGPERHFTSSKIFCWIAFDRGAKLAKRFGNFEFADKWSSLAEEVKDDILAKGVKNGVLTQHYETESLDASLLLAPLTRFLPADDPIIRNTVLAIADNLTENGLVLRYRTDETNDGLKGREGSFMICSFWLVSALVKIGEISRAHSLVERLLSYSSPLRLYAEEYDTETGHHLGNYPQAFTHLALINAIVHVIRAEEK